MDIIQIVNPEKPINEQAPALKVSMWGSNLFFERCGKANKNKDSYHFLLVQECPSSPVE